MRVAPSCIHELIFGCQVCGSNDNNHHISANKRTFNQSRSASPTGVDAEVLKAVDQFYKAFLAGDIEIVKRMTADDCLQTDVNGQVQDKAAWLAQYYEPIVRGMKAGTFKWEVFEREDIKVRRYGDVAVLIGRIRI